MLDMTKEELPPKGTRVLFRSNSPIPARAAFDGAICTILAREEISLDSPAYGCYTDNIGVHVRFPYIFQEPKYNGDQTWVDLKEIHLI